MKDKIKALKDFCETKDICIDCPLEEMRCGKGAYFDNGMSEEEINLAYKLAFDTGEEKPHIKDSGERRQFYDAAGKPLGVRDIQEGKGRCDLLPLDVAALIYNSKAQHVGSVIGWISQFLKTNNIMHLMDALEAFMLDSTPFGDYNWSTMFLEVSKHFEEGAKKYGERNWEKGIPTHCYIDSAVRHYLKWLRGDTDEPHDRAFCWNILCCIWTCQNMPELNDYPIKRGDQNDR